MSIKAILPVLALAAVTAWGQQKYKGPRPPKPDIVYLVHADNLIPTETADAQAKSKKNETTYIIPGANSPARTPLAEPIFMIQSDKIQAKDLELYKMDVKGSNREVTVGKRGDHPLRLTVTRLDTGLYKVEADEELENGEYALSPTGSNSVFCFQIY